MKTGFLPFVDLDTFVMNSRPSSGAEEQGRGGVQVSRQNHAIWDQIGLLHWLKRNIAAFGGDPNNISLVSADNQAASQLQLLSTSPLARGLFENLILVHEQAVFRESSRPVGGEKGHEKREEFSLQELDQLDKGIKRISERESVSLGELIKLGRKSRQLQLKLRQELNLLVRKLLLLERKQEASEWTNSTAGRQIVDSLSNGDERKLFEFLQSASLPQLAWIEAELSNSADRRLFSLATWPNLDDKLLFPHFSPILRPKETTSNASSSAPSSSKSLAAEATHLSTGKAYYSDPLWLAELLSNGTQQTDLSSAPIGWPEVKSRAELCLYLGSLSSTVARLRPKKEAPNEEQLRGELERVDPLGLLPKLALRLQQKSALRSSSEEEKGVFFHSNNSSQSETVSEGQNGATLRPTWRPAVSRGRRLGWAAAQFGLLKQVQLLEGLITQTKTGQRETVGGSGEDEEEEEAATKRRQQQMGLVASGGGSGSGGARRSRRQQEASLLDSEWAARVAVGELHATLSSFHLFVVFVGDPLRASGGQGWAPVGANLDGSELSNLGKLATMLRVLLGDKELQDEFVQLVHFADLHYYANLLLEIAEGRFFEAHCSLETNAEDRLHLRPQSTRRTKSVVSVLPKQVQEQPEDAGNETVAESASASVDLATFSTVSKPEEVAPNNEEPNKWSAKWNLLEKMTHFIGQKANEMPVQWTDEQFYSPFRRNVHLDLNLEGQQKDHLVQKLLHFRLDLASILSSFDEGSLAPKSVPSDWDTLSNSPELQPKMSSPSSQNRQKVHEPLETVGRHLRLCLESLEAASSPLEPPGTAAGAKLLHSLAGVQLLAKFQQEARCLGDSAAKLRARLRANLRPEIEQVMRSYLFLLDKLEKLNKLSKLNKTETANKLDNVEQILVESRQQNSTKVSTMSTRNLVSHADGSNLMFADDHQPALSSVGSTKLTGTLPEAAAEVGRAQQTFEADRKEGGSSNQTSSQGGSIRSLFAKTYKDAVSQALAVVVGTGLLILLLNLLIVLVIALRSKGRRALQTVADESQLPPTEDSPQAAKLARKSEGDLTAITLSRKPTLRRQASASAAADQPQRKTDARAAPPTWTAPQKSIKFDLSPVELGHKRRQSPSPSAQTHTGQLASSGCRASLDDYLQLSAAGQLYGQLGAQITVHPELFPADESGFLAANFDHSGPEVPQCGSTMDAALTGRTTVCGVHQAQCGATQTAGQLPAGGSLTSPFESTTTTSSNAGAHPQGRSQAGRSLARQQVAHMDASHLHGHLFIHQNGHHLASNQLNSSPSPSASLSTNATPIQDQLHPVAAGCQLVANCALHQHGARPQVEGPHESWYEVGPSLSLACEQQPALDFLSSPTDANSPMNAQMNQDGMMIGTLTKALQQQRRLKQRQQQQQQQQQHQQQQIIQLVPVDHTQAIYYLQTPDQELHHELCPMDEE